MLAASSAVSSMINGGTGKSDIWRINAEVSITKRSPVGPDRSWN